METDLCLYITSFALFREDFEMKITDCRSLSVTIDPCEEWAGRSLGCYGLEESPDSAGHGGG